MYNNVYMYINARVYVCFYIYKYIHSLPTHTRTRAHTHLYFLYFTYIFIEYHLMYTMVRLFYLIEESLNYCTCIDIGSYRHA